jgi:hypothetical protein
VSEAGGWRVWQRLLPRSRFDDRSARADSVNEGGVGIASGHRQRQLVHLGHQLHHVLARGFDGPLQRVGRVSPLLLSETVALVGQAEGQAQATKEFVRAGAPARVLLYRFTNQSARIRHLATRNRFRRLRPSGDSGLAGSGGLGRRLS